MMKPVKITITDEIDLHTFRPEEVEDLLKEYFAECIKLRIFMVRVVHGKGTGALKKRVRSALKKNPMVSSFFDARPEAGGWGATMVTLNPTVSTDADTID